MSTAKDPSLKGLNDCGCCEGREISAPAEVSNRPGLKAIAYRIGTHSQLRDSLLSRLSTAGFPALGKLTTREPDDFTIALLDAWAVTADVLTFYQERLANESYLRTAQDKVSVQELACLIGYSLSPGVAASAYLAFTLAEKPAATAGGTGSGGTGSASTGASSQASAAVLRQAAATVPESVTIAVGTKVQSIPGQDEDAQVFETVEAIEARPDWNKMRPLLTEQQTLETTASSLVFKGTSLKLKQGERLLIVADQKKAVRQISEVAEPDSDAGTTTVKLATKSGSLSYLNPNILVTVLGTIQTNVLTGLALAPKLQLLPFVQEAVFVMRACVSLFGHNAPAWKMLPWTVKSQYTTSYAEAEWPTFTSIDGKTIELDAVYSQIVPGSRIVFAPKGDLASATFAKVESVEETGASNYGLSAKVTRLTLDQKIKVSTMDELRKAVVYAQSEELTLADLAIATAIKGSVIELGSVQKDLKEGQTLIVSGETTGSSGTWKSEVAVVQSVTLKSKTTELALVKDLENSFKRKAVLINANVALATHGETVEQILGSGDAGQSLLTFKLKHTPLTYLSASTTSGAETTLKVYVNDLLWEEVSDFLSSGPEDRHYIVRTNEKGETVVRFGDGRAGALPPTGQNNIRAVYRKGSGLDGQIAKDKLSLLLTRSYGLKEVTNPLAAEGGDDPETLAMARANSPLKVKTLDRAVSLQDYEDFALAFAGVAKALATWSFFGEKKGVFLTVAKSQSQKTSSGTSASTGSSALSVEKKLYAALLKAGPPHVPLRVESFRPVTFRLALRLKIDPDYESDKVRTAVKKKLQSEFAFANRSLGQPVYLSEVMAVVQGVSGVEAVDVNALYRTGKEAKLNDRLVAALPGKGRGGSCLGAELLTLRSGELDELGDMS